jgi:hypothetical protein
MGFLGGTEVISVRAFARLRGLAEIVGRRREVVRRVARERESILEMLEGLGQVRNLSR